MDDIRVYDQDNKLLAILDMASEVSYTLKHNDLSVASLRLPSLDPRNVHCQAHNYIRIQDGKRKAVLFRIVAIPQSIPDGWTEYSLEHVQATLLDDVLFGYHEIGGTGTNTRAVITYILARQTIKRWQLGVCDFADYFEYKFENDSLLGALYSIGNVIVDPFTWDFDTTTTPWTLHLRRADNTPGCGIEYMRNLTSITKSMDAGNLITRLYCLGYGEGINQLKIPSINGGRPYIDADTIGVWGVKSAVFADTSIEDATLLKERGQVMLNDFKSPALSYTATALDLYNLTKYEWDAFEPGKLVRVMDSEHGIAFDGRIISISKPDYRASPADITVTIANKLKDSADSIGALAARVGINELYSQGATNQFAMTFYDNADGTHPAKMRVYVPAGTVRINQMLLSWELEAFRAYSQGAAAGGGGAHTSAAGGSGTVTTGTTTSTVSFRTTGPIDDDGNDRPFTDKASGPDLHHHYNHHNHPVSGVVYIPPLQGDIPAHSHSITMPAHTHPIAYGIYEGGTASAITLRVDGQSVPAADTAGKSEIDIVQYMAKDDSGRITRGTWHTVELVPNALTRIAATLFAQTFVQSRGGGDY